MRRPLLIAVTVGLALLGRGAFGAGWTIAAMVIPFVVSLGWSLMGIISRLVRASMLDELGADYVRTARAKGLSERQVMTRHVLRNSLIPVITLFGLDFGATIAGTAIITEVIFSIDGIGNYAAESVAKFELPPIMGVALYGAFFVVLLNTLVDVVYAYLDPRVRLGESASS